MADQRSYTGNNFQFTVNGWNVGFVKKASGGGMKGVIANNALGPDLLVKKHLANIEWEPVTIEVGIGMGKAMSDWIAESFAKGFVTRDATLTKADFHYKATTEQLFNQCLIQEVTCPELSGSAKTSAYFTVKMLPETVRWQAASGQIQGNTAGKQKQWLQCNWRLEGFKGLPCARISKIASWTWKQKTIRDEVGSTKEATIHPGSVEVPSLALTISAADREPWAKAAYDWFINGMSREEDEMEGRIVFLANDMKTELGEVVLGNCGFEAFSDGANDAGSETVASFEVKLYVETMKFNIKYSDA
jgi:hypothetical protein